MAEQRSVGPWKRTLDPEDVRALFHYDPDTGLLTWKADRVCGRGRGRVTAKAGSIAGGIQGPHIRVRVRKHHHAAHVVAWVWMTGEMPPGEVDHIDLNGHNNAWNNLRLSTRSQNAANKAPQKNNTTGFKGLTWDRQTNQWRVQVQMKGRKTYKKRHPCLGSALRDLAKKQRDYHGEFARSL